MPVPNERQAAVAAGGRQKLRSMPSVVQRQLHARLLRVHRSGTRSVISIVSASPGKVLNQGPPEPLCN